MVAGSRWITCRLLAGEGRGNLQSFCPEFKISLRSSQRLHGFDPASHLRFQSPCNFRTLDRFRHSWQAAIIDLWDSIPPDILLQARSHKWMAVCVTRYTKMYHDCKINVY